MKTMIRSMHVNCVLYMLAFLNVGLALFEDQIGLFDWNQKYIGKARFIDQRLTGSHKTYLLGSEKNVIASVASRDGSIVWRQVLEDGGKLVAMTRCDNVLLSVSVKGSAFIRAWDHRSGSIIWETLVPTSASSFDLWCDSFSGKSYIFIRIRPTEVVLFAHGSEVAALDLRAGKITLMKEEHSLSTAPQEVKLIASESSGTHPSVIFLRSAMLSTQTGIARTELAATMISLEKLEQKDVVLVGQSSGLFLTCASVDPAGTGGFLKAVSLTGSQSTNEHIKSETMRISQSPAHLQRINPSHLLVTSSTGSGVVYELNASGQLIQKYLLKNAMFACLASWNGRDFLFTAFQEVEQPFNNFALSVYDAQSGEPIAEFPTRQWTIAIHHGAVESVSSTAHIAVLMACSYCPHCPYFIMLNDIGKGIIVHSAFRLSYVMLKPVLARDILWTHVHAQPSCAVVTP
ncbi:hypothetical protein PHET_08558 [Paragonimus heterotremus]|uniref:EMC1 first beta-propeller domain-containing protein n=1 Tax=Paragonimus heterotremus TaxID=100268 RepID=A0A8J4SMH8_9TREM|nr:hypothetical protein PHET_08558 [Paragonimus heterotremus]